MAETSFKIKIEEGRMQFATMEKTEHETNYIRKSTQQEEILWNSLNLNNVEENSTALTEKNLIRTSKEIGSISYDTEIQITAEEINTKTELNPKNTADS